MIHTFCHELLLCRVDDDGVVSSVRLSRLPFAHIKNSGSVRGSCRVINTVSCRVDGRKVGVPHASIVWPCNDVFKHCNVQVLFDTQAAYRGTVDVCATNVVDDTRTNLVISYVSVIKYKVYFDVKFENDGRRPVVCDVLLKFIREERVRLNE